MCLFWCRALPVMTVLVCLSPGQPPKPPASAETSITGVFIGRSGKPMANARLFLARVEGDQEELEAKVILTTLGPAQTDAQGQFRFKGFAPGKYTIVYYPAGGASIAPAQFSVKAPAAVTRSILPLMKTSRSAPANRYRSADGAPH